MEIRDPGLRVDSRTFVGDPIKVGDRSIYPVLKLSAIKACDGRIMAVVTYPKALAIAEPEETYLFMLGDENTSVEDLIVQVPSLKNILRVK